MNFEETRAILKQVKAEYPQSFRGITREDAEAKLQLWSEMFAADDAQLVKAALKKIISDGNREFAPNVGLIKEQMRRLRPKKGVGEAWQAAINAKQCQDSELGSVSRYAREHGISWQEAKEVLDGAEH